MNVPFGSQTSFASASCHSLFFSVKMLSSWDTIVTGKYDTDEPEYQQIHERLQPGMIAHLILLCQSESHSYAGLCRQRAPELLDPIQPLEEEDVDSKQDMDMGPTPFLPTGHSLSLATPAPISQNTSQPYKIRKHVTRPAFDTDAVVHTINLLGLP